MKETKWNEVKWKIKQLWLDQSSFRAREGWSWSSGDDCTMIAPSLSLSLNPFCFSLICLFLLEEMLMRRNQFTPKKFLVKSCKGTCCLKAGNYRFYLLFFCHLLFLQTSFGQHWELNWAWEPFFPYCSPAAVWPLTLTRLLCSFFLSFHLFPFSPVGGGGGGGRK